MNLRAASRLALMPAVLALLLAACQPSTPEEAAAAPPAADATAAAAPAEAIADEPALDPAAAAAAGDTEASADAGAQATPAGETPPPAPAPGQSAVTFATEGEHYDLIPGGQPFEPLDGKIEVVEVFNYVCPACAMFQPLVNTWKARLPADVRFTYVPAAFGGNWDPYVRAYYAAEAMGIADKSHDGIFQAIHVDRSLKGERGTDSAQDIAQAYAKFGADPAQFASTMASFTVNAKFGRAKQYIAQQRANSTPTMIVNGRYRIKARNFETMLENTDRVIAQVRAGG
ncbi:thiol:disulfide interchange protein DsbA/DsbL [Luteimonas kalidii]|uniref:Thiol:disulfide interchange protein DsbA/DsbL n=1 Tax=Luteimonas kalidii TaxID=3042025 RepID=A0ABT6JY23_9GAMM|nr:thiol:disulfide interchange protein DsbA/DsbL [Luteimonas kalidii]MDH5835051.1 thiol:disulfide interchange protein DsbA/DsbL [Luteimonas kalidii]